jgi:hypothetical protein
MNRKEIEEVRVQAFKEAAELLERTAQDFQQYLDRWKGNQLFTATRRCLKEKVQLLEGQANLVKKLK